MKRMRTVFAAAAILAVAQPATSFASGEAEFGAQNWWQTKKEAKFQEFTEWPNGAYFEKFLLRGQVGSFAATGWGTNLFLEHQATGLSFDQGIKWQLDGSYQQLPHLFSQIARSPFTDLSNGYYALSDSLQRQNQNDPGGYINRMNAELAVAPLIPLTHRTDVADARVRFRPTKGWQFQLNGEQRARAGNKAYAMTFGFSNTNEVVEPINQRMTDITAIADYTKEKMGLRFQVGYSKFDNRVDAFITDNSRRATDSPTAGSSRGRIDLYPDNNAVRGQVDLNAHIAKNTQFAGTLALSRLAQDDPWLPFTINSAIPQASTDSLYGTITARSTDAKALRFTQNYRLTSHVTKAIKGNVHFRQQQYDNQTDEFPFRGVVQYDQSLVRDTVGFVNHPFSNEQVTLGTDWDARVADGVSLLVGYDHRWREHTLREVENDQEDLIRARIYAELSNGLYANAGYQFGRRTQDAFDVSEYQRPDQPDTVYLENPNLRRFDVANRDLQTATGELGYALTDQIDLSFNGEYARSKFDESVLGLQDEERWMLLGQVSFTPASSWDLSGGYGFGRTDTDQGSNERTANADIPIHDSNFNGGTNWTANLRDRNDYGFVQATWKVVPRTVALTTSYWISRDQTDYFLNNATNTAQDLPSTYYLRQEGRFEARYRLPDGTEVIGRYGYDTWKVEDFAATDVPLLNVAGTPPGATAIFLGAGYQGYTTHSLAIAFSRKF